MPERRYTDVRIGSSIYVDSMCHYHASIWYVDRRAGKTVKREYCWDLVDPLGVQSPSYLEWKCDRLFLAALKDPDTRYYEYDRDSNPRYTNLRYYDPTDVANIIDSLEWRTTQRKRRAAAPKARVA